jgi:hypothetical protein
MSGKRKDINGGATMKKLLCSMVLAMLTILSLAWASESRADQALTLTLERLSLDNVDDPPGRWQHEGGRVLCSDGTHIADYAAYRRVTFSGTSPQNTAMLTMTLFFIGELPPQNITLQGSHDFNSGVYIGSVSATSSDFAKVRGVSFSGQAGVTGTLTVKKLKKPEINPCP